LTFRPGQLAGVVAARKQMAVGVERLSDRGVAKPLLHALRWQSEPAVRLAVDAPGREEMAQRVQSCILGFAFVFDDTSRDLDRTPHTIHKVRVALDSADPVRKH